MHRYEETLQLHVLRKENENGMSSIEWQLAAACCPDRCRVAMHVLARKRDGRGRGAVCGPGTGMGAQYGGGGIKMPIISILKINQIIKSKISSKIFQYEYVGMFSSLAL
jgi:hypothetical protein